MRSEGPMARAVALVEAMAKARAVVLFGHWFVMVASCRWCGLAAHQTIAVAVLTSSELRRYVDRRKTSPLRVVLAFLAVLKKKRNLDKILIHEFFDRQ
jgi:hypothetical protein